MKQTFQKMKQFLVYLKVFLCSFVEAVSTEEHPESDNNPLALELEENKLVPILMSLPAVPCTDICRAVVTITAALREPIHGGPFLTMLFALCLFSAPFYPEHME